MNKERGTEKENQETPESMGVGFLKKSGLHEFSPFLSHLTCSFTTAYNDPSFSSSFFHLYIFSVGFKFSIKQNTVLKSGKYGLGFID